MSLLIQNSPFCPRGQIHITQALDGGVVLIANTHQGEAAQCKVFDHRDRKAKDIMPSGEIGYDSHPHLPFVDNLPTGR